MLIDPIPGQHCVRMCLNAQIDTNEMQLNKVDPSDIGILSKLLSDYSMLQKECLILTNAYKYQYIGRGNYFLSGMGANNTKKIGLNT